MDKYLVRWKFAAKSMLNDQDTDTYWYQQFHQTKASAVKQIGRESCRERV